MVKVHQGVSIIVDGALVAAGTPTGRVTITSITDASVGGDSNGDANATSPVPGDWNQIFVSGSASLTYTDVAYGGSTGAAPTIACLHSITNVSVINGTVAVNPPSPFAPGVTSAVVTATKTTAGIPTTFSFDVQDKAGNIKRCA